MHSKGVKANTDYPFKISATIFSIFHILKASCDRRGVFLTHAVLTQKIWISKSNASLALKNNAHPKLSTRCSAFDHRQEQLHSHYLHQKHVFNRTDVLI